MGQSRRELPLYFGVGGLAPGIDPTSNKSMLDAADGFVGRRHGSGIMGAQLKMVYWKGEHFWLGKLVDHPEIMSQGESIEELEENLRDAYRELLLDDVPAQFQIKDIAL